MGGVKRGLAYVVGLDGVKLGGVGLKGEGGVMLSEVRTCKIE